MFKTIKNALKTPDVRKRLLYTLILIVLFRLGCYITVPGVNMITLNDSMSSSNGIAGFIDIISGGAFSRFSVFAMSVSPYITASIVVQLLTMIIPSLERISKEGGEEGRKIMNRWTKIITIILALVEAIGIYLSYRKAGIFINEGWLTGILVVSSLVAGTSLLMWLGEQITSKGIGIIIGAIILVSGVVFVQQAERRVPVQYSKKVVGRKMVGAQSTFIPLKLAMAGVMPVIFASSFMTFPAMIISMFADVENLSGFWSGVYKFSIATSSSSVGWGYSLGNAIVYLLLIVAFTFFYTYATFNPAEVSNNIKKNGGFIPGIRAGKPTTEYLSSIITKLTVFGGLFLAVIAIVPMLLRFTSLNVSFGGTSILIVVGVALETVQQLESQLVMRHYKGFLE